MFCWETLCLGIQADVNLTCETYLKIFVDHVQLLMGVVFPGGSGIMSLLSAR